MTTPVATATVEPFNTLTLHDHAVAELRSDHTGEAGAVMIYQGILAVSTDPDVRAFALRHLATEAQHLQFFETWLPAHHRSRLLPLWRLAGWLTGALPALLGPRWVYATIEAVETFVVAHYQAQLTPSMIADVDLRQVLGRFAQDEAAHQKEAAVVADPERRPLLRLWLRAVSSGSRRAVGLARVL